ncbi:MAG: hypothetical protein P8101_01185, partial [Candidatus Thiodiazotropha sp.]
FIRAVLALGRVDPTGLLVGFGVFALAVALIYRRPVPARDASLAVVAVTALACLLFNVALGLLVGLGAKWVRRYFEGRSKNNGF